MMLCDEQMVRKAQAHEKASKEWDKKKKHENILYIFMFDTHLMLFGYIARTFVYAICWCWYYTTQGLLSLSFFIV